MDAWDATKNRWATSSATYFESTQTRWATTSSDYWLTQNRGQAFSTTSANYLLNASTTIPRTTLANAWTAVQSFTAGFLSNASSTFTGFAFLNGGASTTDFTVTGNTVLGSATTTVLFAATASTTNFFGAGLTLCQSGNVLTWANGSFGCAADQTGGGGGVWPFTPSTNYSVGVQSTSTPIWATGGLMASSTSYFVNASSTALTVSGTALFGTATSTTLNSNNAAIGSLTAGTLSLSSLGTFAGGFLSQASSTVAGLLTALNSSSSLATIGTLWLPGVTNTLLSTDSAGKLTATSTPTASSFIATGATASVFPYASSTAFTVSGTGYFGLGAFTSTTGTTTVASGQGFAVGGSQLVVQQGSGKVGVGTASPAYALDVNGDVNVASGKCFRVNGTCIGYVTKLAAIYATSTPGTNISVVFGNGGPKFSNGTLTLPATTTQMVVEVWGGGGSGATGDSTTIEGGGGGGAGAYLQKILTAPLAEKYFYNIGAGGASQGTIANDGSAGTASSFGTGLATSTANAGSGGGAPPAASQPGTGGAGGVASSGDDIDMPGGEGADGGGGVNASTYGVGGYGGSAPRGGSGGKGGAGRVGESGQPFGGGGGGTTGYPSGAGGSGGLVITIYATSSPTAAGNDYAEMFPVSNPGITAGDIVAADAGMPVSMELASAGENLPLAGIIATDPGQLLGDKNAAGNRPVALAGRVPAKVNLEGGPISIGDRIAPSSVPGVGRKASPLDASVGIALEEFSGGADGSQQGTVTVFIDLQRGVPIEDIGNALLITTSSTSALGGAFDFVDKLLSAISARIGAAAAWNAAPATTTATTTAATSTQQTALGLFFDALFARIKAWFADAANGIGDFFAKRIVGDQLCARKSDGSLECLTGDQLAAVVTATGQTLRPSSTESTAPRSTDSAARDTATSSVLTTPPMISINGNNPAHINIGDTYQDLGATAKDSEGHDLGVKTFLNGAFVIDIVIDTSTATIGTIDYVATDTSGNAATATRSVIIEPLAPLVTDPAPAVVPDAPPLAPEELTAEISVVSDAPADPADAAAQE